MNNVGTSQDLSVRFLAESEQSGYDIAQALVAFIAQARYSLDFAIYDFRLSPALREPIETALRERAQVGVSIRIAYYADKPGPEGLMRGIDPGAPGTGAFVQSLGYPFRRISGRDLMHQKYVIRDGRIPADSDTNNKYIVRDSGTPAAAVWTGSTNFTDDAWTLQENNILQLASQDLATAYTHDFADLWSEGTIEHSGAFDPAITKLTYGGMPALVRPHFSPGRGVAIDHEIARLVSGARRRILICSMLLNSGALLNALSEQLQNGYVEVAGVYDRTQMQSVLVQWQDVPHNHWKIGAIRQIVADAGLVGKNSTPYSPTGRHDFMHAKVLVVDNTVITGSYNFSRSAEFNAENILHIECPSLAETYAGFVEHLRSKYASHSVGDIGA